MRLTQHYAAQDHWLFIGVSASAQKGAVKVDLSEATGKECVGRGNFSPAAQGVTIRLNLKDLRRASHAIHVHTVAKCEGPAFTSAGPHLKNPGYEASWTANQGPHAGDMPEFTVSADGTAEGHVSCSRSPLWATIASVFKHGGTALVVHAKADDMKSDPAGNPVSHARVTPRSSVTSVRGSRGRLDRGSYTDFPWLRGHRIGT